MNEMALVSMVVTLMLVACLSLRRPRRLDTLRRLHPGVAHKAEWMASDETVRRVESDYLAAQYWSAQALLSSYTAYLSDLPRYFVGGYLREQERSISQQMRRRGPRLVGVLRTHHQVQVRRFSDDGLTCCLIDHQTERRMATYDYWTKRRMHTQDLGDGVYVYRMRYDEAAQNWKIEALIQQLPLGWDSLLPSNATLRLTDELPIAAGRDV